MKIVLDENLCVSRMKIIRCIRELVWVGKAKQFSGKNIREINSIKKFSSERALLRQGDTLAIIQRKNFTLVAMTFVGVELVLFFSVDER